MSSTKFTPLSDQETASFCSQMALILKAGISSVEGITIMLEDAGNSDEKKLLSHIYESMIETGSLHQSLASTAAFPSYLLQIVQIGEETGRQDEVMASLAEYYEKEDNLAQTIRHAVTYPCIMVLLMIFIIVVLITRVMPVFHQVFQQLGSEMTGFSRIMLNIGNFLNSHSVVFVCVLAALFCIGIFLLKTEPGWHFLHKLTYKFSRTRDLSDQISAFRFSNGMALTLSSGLTPEECLQKTLELTDHGPFRHKLNNCCSAVENGEELCSALLDNGVFTGAYARMSVIGSRTGVLDEVMHTIARQCEADIDERLSRLIAKIEPTFVIILSLIVGAILFSVMLPLVEIMSAL